jgi:hypothetical protein
VGLLLAAARVGFGQERPAEPSIPLEAQRDPVFHFAASTFEPYVGDIFTAPNARGEAVELRLAHLEKYVAVNRLTKRARKSESFTLLFKASNELPPFTSIHTISHPRLGKFDLFLTRRKSETGILSYEAVINHAK